MITLAQAKKFAAIRNKSKHNSNLQFSFDCSAAGFSVADLGDPEKKDINWYEWTFPWGRLIEKYGEMTVEKN